MVMYPTLSRGWGPLHRRSKRTRRAIEYTFIYWYIFIYYFFYIFIILFLYTYVYLLIYTILKKSSKVTFIFEDGSLLTVYVCRHPCLSVILFNIDHSVFMFSVIAVPRFWYTCILIKRQISYLNIENWW